MTGVQSPASRSRRQISVPSRPGRRDVEDAGHRAQPAGGGQPGRAVALQVYAEAVPGQVEPDQVGDGRLVLHHEDEPALPGGVDGHRPMMPDPGPTARRRRCSSSVRMTISGPGNGRKQRGRRGGRGVADGGDDPLPGRPQPGPERVVEQRVELPHLLRVAGYGSGTARGSRRSRWRPARPTCSRGSGLQVTLLSSRSSVLRCRRSRCSTRVCWVTTSRRWVSRSRYSPADRAVGAGAPGDQDGGVTGADAAPEDRHVPADGLHRQPGLGGGREERAGEDVHTCPTRRQQG